LIGAYDTRICVYIYWSAICNFSIIFGLFLFLFVFLFCHICFLFEFEASVLFSMFCCRQRNLIVSIVLGLRIVGFLVWFVLVFVIIFGHILFLFF